MPACQSKAAGRQNDNPQFKKLKKFLQFDL
jgi:hypothetical protein